MASQAGSMIAARHLTVEGRPRRKVRVRLSRPYKESTGTWVCRFKIDGLGKHRVNAAYGVDAFQALQLAFEAIRIMLDETGRKLTWVETGSPGFPRYVPNYFGPAFERRLSKLIDREVSRFARDVIRKHK